MIRTKCPLGGPEEADKEIYPANFDPEQLTSDVFSARRTPDRLHYRMVRNEKTNCLRADPILDDQTLLSLYETSRLQEEEIWEQAAETYFRYAKHVWPLIKDYRGILEIGCGNGAFLHKIADKGFKKTAGVEPSQASIAQADPAVKDHIKQGFFKKGIFTENSFSLICGFQVLDHMAEPNDVLSACYEQLTSGGLTYWICHDIGSPIARLLGRSSPMIDVEHIVLYNRQTLRALFEQNNFEVIRIFGVYNSYPLGYWYNMAPLPKVLKSFGLNFLKFTRLGRMKLKANFGNMGIIARKP